MARTTATVAFNAIELKGSLLPGSLLDQVARLGAKHQDPKDYGLEKNERLRDRIDAAWVLAKDLWAEYVGLKERAGQGVAGLHFSLRLLVEGFEWDDVQPVKGWQRGDASYPITHRAFGGAVPLIIKGVDSVGLDRGLRDFGQENRKRSPHSCLQECLNADENSDWGLLITGDRLRLLHDNPSLVKPAYLGADLEWMIEGDLFDEFAVLWLTLHASRFRHTADGNCVLDGWKQEAEDTGERILGQLRGGVQTALEQLANGVLAHPANQRIRETLESGSLSRQVFHEELLRLVYRFLFLFTAEDRELLFPQAVSNDDPRRQIYREGYSVGRLRELALKRSAYEGNYGDLWELQRLVFQQLSISNSPLGLPGLGGLFSEEQCPNLRGCELSNGFLLRAIKAIGWFDAGGTLTRVNYRDLNTEELGSVYEGLLELHPELEKTGGLLQLGYQGGADSERKTSGSYYTPDVLVQELIKSALMPVIWERLKNAKTSAEKKSALLAIRVLDLACGSGHFLLAAGRRLALELAKVLASDEEPSEELRQHCMREVVAHCLFGVDKNPMAVELCKVALWMEAIDPGKPLGFLDSHIQWGDSLVGVFEPQVLEAGIPEEAFKPLNDDEKLICSSLSKDNSRQRKAFSSNRSLQPTLDLFGQPAMSDRQSMLSTIEAMPDSTLAETAAKQLAYDVWLRKANSDLETLAANLFCAAFFLPKTSVTRAMVPTTEHLLTLRAGQRIPHAMEQAVQQAAGNLRFFHWYLRFGEVIKQGGFDCVLGNPPWVSFSGRQAIKDPRLSGYLTTLFPSISSWPSLHPCFMISGVRLLSIGGSLGFVLPSQMFEQASYQASLSVAAIEGGQLVRLTNVGENAFRGVTQSSALLTVQRIKGPADIWHGKGAGQSLLEINEPAGLNFVSGLSALDTFPPETFSDPGIHTGNISKKVIVSTEYVNSLSDSERLACLPLYVREGKQIAEFYLSPPAKYVLTGYEPLGSEYWTIRARIKYENVPILLRQTASRPIAALHKEPCYFRNSMLACNGSKLLNNRTLVCILNSGLIALFHRAQTSEAGQKVFPQVKIKHLRSLPMPSSRFVDSEPGRLIIVDLNGLHDIANREVATLGRVSIATKLEIERSVLSIYQQDKGLAEAIFSLTES
jgi:hypothetical protein